MIPNFERSNSKLTTFLQTAPQTVTNARMTEAQQNVTTRNVMPDLPTNLLMEPVQVSCVISCSLQSILKENAYDPLLNCCPFLKAW